MDVNEKARILREVMDNDGLMTMQIQAEENGPTELSAAIEIALGMLPTSTTRH